MPTAKLGDSDGINVGDWVVAIGNPYGLSNSVTAGIVSAKGRAIGAGPYDDFIQTDAPINPGNSGGPLLNDRGEVVGINSAIFSQTGGSVGIGFAIPINLAKKLVPELEETGHVTRAWLGVTIQELTPDLAKSLNVEPPHGALVAGVASDSPAAASGIKPGDVITRYDGKEVKEHATLPMLVASTTIGKTVPVEVVRDGKVETFEVTVSPAGRRRDSGEGGRAQRQVGPCPSRPQPRRARATESQGGRRRAGRRRGRRQPGGASRYRSGRPDPAGEPQVGHHGRADQEGSRFHFRRKAAPAPRTPGRRQRTVRRARAAVNAAAIPLRLTPGGDSNESPPFPNGYLMTTLSRGFVRDAWRIILPYWRSEDRRAALGLLATIVALNLGAVYVLVLLNAWNRAFYDALQQRDFAAFAHELGHFCWLAALFIVTAVYRQYLTQTLEMRWRRWLTHEFLGRWLGDRAYYHFERIHRGTDNPDQRIAEDLQLITSGSLSLASGLLNAAVTLFSFIGILWSLSAPLTVPLGGSSLDIPASLVWAAILYALGGSIVTHRIGRPLVGLNARQQRAEADFRFGLVRLREKPEEVALYGGEALEQRSLAGRFTAILDNWRRLLLAQKRLTWFTAGYGQAATVFPILVAAPRYFSGAIQLGTLMQIASAFGRVQDALSWFVDSYGSLAEWKASMDRVRVFAEGMTAAAVSGGGAASTSSPTPRARSPSATSTSRSLPERRSSETPLSWSAAASTCCSTGPSGSGKSTIFRTIAGLWPYGRGEIRRPAEPTLFLPQRSYMPIATLREAIAYPSDPRVLGDGAIVAALRRCRLDRLIPRLGEAQHWEQQLSPGEQQLLALARVFLHAPAWLFLDEATSALDERRSGTSTASSAPSCPETTIVSIAHRPGVAAYHERRVELLPVGDVMGVRELSPVESAA